MNEENKTPVENTPSEPAKSAEKKTLTFDEMLKEENYQAEFDRRVQKALATAKSKWEETKPNTEIKDSKNDTDLKKELEALKQQIADKEKREEDARKDNALTNDIIKTFGDKEFINEYTKNAIIGEIKSIYNKEDNVKSLNDIFTEITKDKEDIFTNPNQVKDIPNVSTNVFTNVDKEAFSKMGYQERIALKEENPELFKQLNEN